ncbi:MAG: ATPase [Bacteroidales bacterium]|nr:ATPase [Bacteroidales bacterium]
MSIKLGLLRIIDFFNLIRKRLLAFLDTLGLLAALSGFLIMLYHIGFGHETEELISIQRLYNIILCAIILSNVSGLFIKKWKVRDLRLRLSELAVIPLLLLILNARTGFTGVFWTQGLMLDFLTRNLAVYLIFLIALIIEVSTSTLKLKFRNTNPGLLFTFSFLFIIVFGTVLLMLPKATFHGIGLTDAFFTSTSAVCVTGLLVVDTATCFTPLGKLIIIALIQVGGLGVMTFTSFFGYFFKGGASFGNEFLLKELINEEKLGEIFKTLLKIILVTFSIETVGAVIIYYSLDSSGFSSHLSMIGFSSFHSISAFCNAGFSTLSQGLYQPGFRFNYNLHYVIGILVIIGGLGFPVIFNYYRLLKHFLKNKYHQIIGKKGYVHAPKIINLNSRVALITTLVLLLTGFVFFFFSEYNHSLKDLSVSGKVAGAFFGSVTARTAGFNTADMSLLAPVSVLLYLFLMWVGASPASTGGGIKTTTFAVAVLNFFHLSKGQDKIEVYGRELTKESVSRAFAVIFLSFLVISIAVFTLVLTDGQFNLSKIVFEVVSAFGTVGLSLGITAYLSIAGKWVLIITMFLGRIGTLTILVGIFRRLNRYNYHFLQKI